MADKKEEDKDPLSFFSVGDDSSSSESDSENEDEHQPKDLANKDKELYSPKTKLPPPDSLFATVGRPSFLSTKEETTVDWDALSKQCEPGTYGAEPQISLQERENNPEYSDAFVTSEPQKYAKQLTDIQKHLLVHGKRPANDIRAMAHREGSSDNQGENTSKKKKKS